MSDVARAFELGVAAFPGLPLGLEEFTYYLEARAPEWRLDHAADLFLACACLTGVPRAAAELMDRYLAKTPAYLGKLASNADVVAEVRQRLAVHLLVGDGETPPRLGEYVGRGPLEGWLRVVATRTALNLQRGDQRRASWTDAVADRVVDDGGELAIIKTAYREPFRAALIAAVKSLAREHRLLMRLHYVDGMTTAQLAALHRVSRPTIVRRVRDARDALVAGLQARLRESLRLGDDEVDEAFAMVQSQLEVSLARLLRETIEGS